MQYKDDTLFENMDIFRDFAVEPRKISNKKDNFNAKSLLSQKIEEIISDDEEQKINDSETDEIGNSINLFN